jgi:hypothetical protein
MIYALTKSQYIRYPHFCDLLDDKVRIAYARCPKCRSYIGVYKGEVDEEGLLKLSHRCACGFRGRLQLDEWETQ